jgi:hypothetical protein
MRSNVAALGVDCTAFQVEDEPAEPPPTKKGKKKT